MAVEWAVWAAWTTKPVSEATHRFAHQAELDRAMGATLWPGFLYPFDGAG